MANKILTEVFIKAINNLHINLNRLIDADIENELKNQIRFDAIERRLENLERPASATGCPFIPQNKVPSTKEQIERHLNERIEKDAEEQRSYEDLKKLFDEKML